MMVTGRERTKRERARERAREEPGSFRFVWRGRSRELCEVQVTPGQNKETSIV